MRRWMGSISLTVTTLLLMLGVGLALSQQDDAPENEDVPEVEVPLVIPDTASCIMSSRRAMARCRVKVRASLPSGAGIW